MKYSVHVNGHQKFFKTKKSAKSYAYRQSKHKSFPVSVYYRGARGRGLQKVASYKGGKAYVIQNHYRPAEPYLGRGKFYRHKKR